MALSGQCRAQGMAGQGEQHLSEEGRCVLISFSGEDWRFYGSIVVGPTSAGRSLGYSEITRTHSLKGFNLWLSLRVLL